MIRLERTATARQLLISGIRPETSKAEWGNWDYVITFHRLTDCFPLSQRHSVRCVSKCARPICSGAPHTACQASGCSVFISGGAAFRPVTLPTGRQVEWLRTSAEIRPRGRKRTGHAAAPGAIHRGKTWSRLLFPSPGFVARWAECGLSGVCRFFGFFLSPNKTGWESWSKLERMWIYSGSTCQVSRGKKWESRMQTRQKKQL